MDTKRGREYAKALLEERSNGTLEALGGLIRDAAEHEPVAVIAALTHAGAQAISDFVLSVEQSNSDDYIEQNLAFLWAQPPEGEEWLVPHDTD